MRAAAVQFEVGTDVAANLAAALRMIDQAAKSRPDLIVLPEFCNHAGWYPNNDYAYQIALPLDADFLRAIAAKAAEHRTHIVVNVTVERAKGEISGTSLLYGPDGSRLGLADKQVLLGGEHDLLTPAREVAPIVNLSFGRLGMFSGADELVNETARGLALRGARILAHSINSFALEDAALHVPARAAENKAFVVAANKVGWLVPQYMAGALASQMNIPPEQLQGAGESQIVAPDGTVLAKADRHGEAVAIADFDPAAAEHKLRPDGTHIFHARRPSLYSALAVRPHERRYRPGSNEILAAVAVPSSESIDGCVEVIREAAARGAKIVTLPELPHLPGRRVESVTDARRDSERLIGAVINALLGTDTVAVFSVVGFMRGGFAHIGVAVSEDGLLVEQAQLHPCGRHTWAPRLDDSLRPIRRQWGTMAVIPGGDSIYPEVFRLAALQNVEVCAVPTHLLERWEMHTGLPERAAENRMSILAASRATPCGSGGIFAVTDDLTPAGESLARRPNVPQVTSAEKDTRLTFAPVYPSASASRLIAPQTDLVDGRPWWLLDALVAMPSV